MAGLILIADDDELLRAHAKAALNAAGFAVVDVDDGAAALREARGSHFDLIILDRSMTALDGMSVLQSLREEGIETSVMFLTASGELYDRVQGLEAGADDYLTKPFETSELIARARALTRRPARLGDKMLTAGAVRLDINARRAFVERVEVELTSQDFEILEIFVRNPSRVFSRETLAFRLGANEAVSAAAIEHAISRLRRKLAQTGNADVIETVRGAGYRLANRSEG